MDMERDKGWVNPGSQPRDEDFLDLGTWSHFYHLLHERLQAAYPDIVGYMIASLNPEFVDEDWEMPPAQARFDLIISHTTEDYDLDRLESIFHTHAEDIFNDYLPGRAIQYLTQGDLWSEESEENGGQRDWSSVQRFDAFPICDYVRQKDGAEDEERDPRLLGICLFLSCNPEEIEERGDLYLLSWSAVTSFVNMRLQELHQHMRAELQAQLRTARKVQESFLPRKLPSGVAAYCEPSREIGGDYYGLLGTAEPGNETSLGLILADVSGKGPSAALITVMIKTLIQVKCGDRSGAGADELPALVRFVNEELQAELADGYHFATMICLTVEAEGFCRIVNCAHPPILLLRADGQLEEIGPRNPPVGLIPFDAEMTCLKLEPGDALLLYTDGISEGINAAGEMYGDERLRQAFRRADRSDENRMLADIKDDFTGFTGNIPPRDDATLVVLLWKGAAPCH